MALLESPHSVTDFPWSVEVSEEMTEHLHAEDALYADYVLPDYEAIAGYPSVQFGEPQQQGNYGVTHMDLWQMNDEVVLSIKPCAA